MVYRLVGKDKFGKGGNKTSLSRGEFKSILLNYAIFIRRSFEGA
jgi:hypothetical protein